MTPHTVLIVEDNVLNLDLVLELLAIHGYQTLEAMDADTGLQLAETHRPDLILMDLYLPGKDGFEATRQLKANPVTRHIPVVAYTALGRHEDEHRALGAGCADVLRKPIDVGRFAQLIAAWISPKTKPSA